MNHYLRKYASSEVESLLEIVSQTEDGQFLRYLLEMVANELSSLPNLECLSAGGSRK